MIRRDELPFQLFERAHLRVELARQELAAALAERERAIAEVAKLGYAISEHSADVLPLPLPDAFDAERGFSIRV